MGTISRSKSLEKLYLVYPLKIAFLSLLQQIYLVNLYICELIANSISLISQIRQKIKLHDQKGFGTRSKMADLA